ncbi:MAG: NifU family protein [Mycobacterium sp.]
MIGIHPERVAGDPQAVRWVVPAGSVAVGRVRSAPGPLGEMISRGTISDALAEDAAVWLWLRDGLSWSEYGSRVRTALRDALGEAEGWGVDPAPGDVLAAVTSDLLDGSVGEFIRSHGGSVSVQQSGEEVSVRLGGACEHCPAAGHTLRLRLIEGLRRRCPTLVDIGSEQGETRLRLA